MELRRRYTRPISKFLIYFLLNFLSYSAFAQEVVSDSVVEASPVDIFTDRSGLWHSQKATADRGYGLNPFESLRRIPGVQSRFEGSPTISIRGSQSLPRVLGLYNGIPLNSADGFGPGRLLIPHEAISEIRIFKGPASVFFGSDAMGGAVNFLARRLEGPTLRGNIGSHGQKGIFGGLPLYKSQNSYNHLTSFSEGYDGGYPYNLSSSDKASVRSNTNRALQRHTFFGEQKTGRWNFNENFIWAQEISTSPGPVNSPEGTHNRYSSGLGSLSSSYRVSGNTEVSHRVYSIKNANEYRDSFGQSFADSFFVGNSASIRNRWSPIATSEFFVDHRYDDFKNTYTGSRYFTTSDTEVGSTLDYALDNNLILKPGTRYLFTYKTFVSAIGLFQEDQKLKKWLTYSEGFHAPSLIQRFANNGKSLANTDLKPESSSQVEIGFNQGYVWNESTPWNKAELELSVYSIKYKDFISTQTLSTGETQPVNTDSASGYGVEASGSLNYEVWKFAGAYSYLKAEDNLRNPLPLSPENQYQISAGMNWAVLYFELIHTIWDNFYDRSFNSLVRLNSWNSTDFTIETVNLNDWTIKASALNIFDRPIELTYNYPEPQRRFLLSVERVF